MYEIKFSASFRKDYKRSLKRGLREEQLKKVVNLLATEGTLTAQYKPHKLKGKYAGLWECHIQPDWLLIWDQNEEIRLISLIRTGSHSDLF